MGYDLSGRLQNYELYLVSLYWSVRGESGQNGDALLILPRASRSCHWDQFLKRGKRILRLREEKTKLELPTHHSFVNTRLCLGELHFVMNIPRQRVL